jgi:thiol-disulfide isomerase/thioredoxin
MVRHKGTWVAIAVAGIVALGAGLYWGRTAMEGGARRDASTLLALSLPDTAGKEQSFGQWKGKLLIVNFWATWCEPCRDEMPQFVETQQRFGANGLQFVGIAIDQADKVQQFATEIHLNYPALIGGYGAIELSKTLGNRLGALPFTVIVDRSGHIVHTQLGRLNESQLQSFIKQLL